MRNKTFILGLAVLMALATSCASHYHVTAINRTRQLIDNTFDKPVPQTVADFMKPFNQEVDKLMSPVLGTAAKDLTVKRPEAPLSNLLPDVLVWSGKLYDEKPDFGIYNIGGIRASIAKGDITIGDVFDVAPFENKVCFITLSGKKVLELMGQIAYRGGEGISKEVRIVATKDGKLKSATISGKEIDPDASYRVATVDYLSHGNDRMTAFKDGTDRRELPGEDDLTRTLFMKYIKEQTANGKLVDCDIEGRFTIAEE